MTTAREGHHRAVSATAAVRSPRVLLGLAAVAVAFAAADTYVVVLALPEMMGSTGIPIDQLQRAAPIVSGFLLGLRRDAAADRPDRRPAGRVPVLAAALVVFAVGSLVTALAYDLPSMVSGGSSRASAAAGWSPRRWPWSRTSTRSSAAAYPSASSPRSRSWAR